MRKLLLILVPLLLWSCKTVYRTSGEEPSAPNSPAMSDSVLLLSRAEWRTRLDGLDTIPLTEYTERSMTGWHIPSRREAERMKMSTELDTKIRYLCLDGDEYYTFSTQEGSKFTKAGRTVVYAIRLVLSYPAANYLETDYYKL